MPLRVLLADDSVPAQNMGKKILAEAGYDVLTVSNGLEALRKIAVNPPDIAILDIFMPGYTGLEICERLRGSAATARLPVILTVGKLEPYRPEDGEHVHSNAIIVKPFAAAELISAVRSLIGTALSADKAAEPLPEAGRAAVAEPALPAEGEADEPLFAQGAYSGAPPVSGAGSNRLESLTFNPDAKPIPFSASVLDDLLPSTSHYPEHNPPTFTEFDLELQSSPYFSKAVPQEPAASEPSFSAAAETVSPEPEVLMPEATPAPDEILSGSGTFPEPASAGLNIPALDPLLELPETSLPSFDSLETVDAAGPLDSLTPGIPAAHDEPISEQLSPEEESRRRAFEELFNSDEPIPLDDFCPQSAVTAAAPLSNIAAPASHLPDIFAPDPDLLSVDQPEFSAPRANPYPPMDVELIEVAPLGTVGPIPERDPLLDEMLERDQPETASAPEPETASAPEPETAFVPVPETTFVPEPETASASEPEATFAPPSGELAVPQSDEVAEAAPPEASFTAAATETQPIFTEAASEAPEVLDPEPESAGLAPTAEEIPEAALTSGIEPPEIPQIPETADEPGPRQPEQIVPEVTPQPIIPEAAPPETPQPPPEPVPAVLAPTEPEIAELAPPLDTGTMESAATPAPPQPQLSPLAPESASLETEQTEPASGEVPAQADAASAPPALETSELDLPELETPEPLSPEPEALAAQLASSELSLGPNDAERVNQAVDRVFDRFKRLLVRAILRELSRPE